MKNRCPDCDGRGGYDKPLPDSQVEFDADCERCNGTGFIFKCPGCNEEVNEINHEFRSVIHEHHSVKGGMKSRLLLHCKVKDVESGAEVAVCKKCRLKLGNGMSSGGNSE